jgi:hypothetical protein
MVEFRCQGNGSSAGATVGVGVAMPQSLRGVGVAREDRITRVAAFDPPNELESWRGSRNSAASDI